MAPLSLNPAPSNSGGRPSCRSNLRGGLGTKYLALCEDRARRCQEATNETTGRRHHLQVAKMTATAMRTSFLSRHHRARRSSGISNFRRRRSGRSARRTAPSTDDAQPLLRTVGVRPRRFLQQQHHLHHELLRQGWQERRLRKLLRKGGILSSGMQNGHCASLTAKAAAGWGRIAGLGMVWPSTKSRE